MASTNGLESEIKFGEKIVRMIDAIMKQALRNSPADLAAWRSARRIVKNPTSSAPVFLPVQIAPHPVSATTAASAVGGTPVAGIVASPVPTPVATPVAMPAATPVPTPVSTSVSGSAASPTITKS